MQSCTEVRYIGGLDRRSERLAGLDANHLKLIAICAMLVDHCAVVFVPADFPALWLLRMVGRMTAPIMCYFIAEGYYHTSNLKKYMLRLLLVAVISHFPHNLCFNQSVVRFWDATDVMVSLLSGLLALTVWKNERFPTAIKLGLVGVCCLLAYSADWNYIAVLWILGFGVFHGDIRKQLLAFCAVTGIYLLQPFIYGTSIAYVSRFGVFLVIPLLLAYNGQRGKKSSLMKWGFYWFYPLHLAVLYLLRLWT